MAERDELGDIKDQGPWEREDEQEPKPEEDKADGAEREAVDRDR
jgi:hypothetical protein